MNDNIDGAARDDAWDGNYPGLDFDEQELRTAMRQTYDDIIDFVRTPEFRQFYDEMMRLRPSDRVEFVGRILFDSAELDRRGISIPEGLQIQLSAFGDRRPTLFAIKKLMPEKYQLVWENMNITINNEFDDNAVSRSIENAWRPPLLVAVQNRAIASGDDLEGISSDQSVRFGMYE